MRERASGESKLQGKKAVKLVSPSSARCSSSAGCAAAAREPHEPPRVVVVLGYSDGGRDALHPVCAARLARAAEISTEEDVVVLSGWARVPGTRSEAELMAAAWTGGAASSWSTPMRGRRSGNAVNALERHPPRRRTRGRRRHLTLARAAGAGRVPALAVEAARARPGGVPARAAEPRARRCASCRSGPCCPRSSGMRRRPGRVSPLGVSRKATGRYPRRYLDLDVNPVLRVAQRPAAAAGPYGEDLGQDRERRLLLRVGADVEAARAHDPVELLLRHARLEQAAPAALGRPARAERADVERLALERRLQRRLVELVVVGQDDDGRLVVGRDLGDRLLRPLLDQHVGRRHALGRQEHAPGRRRRSPSSRAASRPGRATRPCRPRRRRRGEAAARTTRRTPSSRRRARAACCGRAARARRTGRSPRRARRRRCCSPVSSTSSLPPMPSPSTTVNRTPRSPEARSSDSRCSRLTRRPRRTRRSRRRTAARRPRPSRP